MTRIPQLPALLLFTSALLPSSVSALASEAGSPEALRIFVRAGPATHGPGEHEHEQFLAEWLPLLRERGAMAVGALRFPGEEELERADVLVMYAAEAASIHGPERERLERFLARGGGVVVIHDAICGDAPSWFRDVVGGAWEHGRSKWHVGEMGLHLTDLDHPITRGAASFDLVDELYHELHLSPDAQVLANAFHTPFDVTPQMWTYEKDAYRAFVSIPGHYHTTFSHPAYRTLLLRGIAWAGGRDVDLLVSSEEVAALRYPPGGPTAPDQAHVHLEAHPDIRIELVAAEPLVVNPISIDWDARGRMWVALTPGYPYKQEFSGVPARDELVILEDTDGDGRMDRRIVFHGGLDLVTSFVLHRDGAIVSQAPEILFLRDTDGDDRADVVEVLYSGFGYADTHATVSNMRLGPDGWIYATQGYSGNDSRVRGKDGRDFGRIGNGVLRFRPDGSAIETVVSYGSNTWGLDFRWDGELFFTMANGAHLRHVVVPDPVLARGRIGRPAAWADVPEHDRVFPLLRHERPPYVQIDFVGGFTAASGCLIYGGGAWPAEFDGNHFVCEPTVHLVHRDVLEPHGTTFRATKPRQAEFLAGRDPWFRPVHLRTGPDGHIYVLDFYNQAVTHNDTRGPRHGPTNAAIRPDRDHRHGRIWRLVHREAKEFPRVDLASLSVRDLPQHLEHPNAWVRETTRRLLLESQDVQAVLAVRRLIADGVSTARGRLETRRMLTQFTALPEGLLELLLEDPDPDVRRGALRIAAERASPPDYAGTRGLVVERARDGDPRTRLLALIALAGYEPREGEARTVAELYPELGDDASRSVAFSVLAREPLVALRAIRDVSSAGTHDLASREPLVAALAERVARSDDGAARAELLIDFAASTETPPPLAAAALRALVREASGPAPAASPALSAALEGLLEAQELDVALAALPLAERWGGPELAGAVDGFAAKLAETLADPEAPERLRLACLEATLALPAWRAGAIEAGEALLEPWLEPDVRLAAIEQLGACEEPAAAAALVAAWPSFSEPARERAFAALVQRPASTAVLLDALEAGRVAGHDLGPQRVHRLRHHPDAAIAERAARVLEDATRADVAIEETIARLLPVVTQPGDAERGAEVFRQNCSTCHSIGGQGADVGPALDGMGAHGPEGLLPYILNPNRSVEPGYIEYVASTLDGRVFGGLLARETSDMVVLRGADGDVEILREDLDVLRSTGRSLMPSGFEILGDEALRDLMAFLCLGYESYRILELDELCTASTARGLFDEREPVTYTFSHFGMHEVEGVPFEVLDPHGTPNGNNAIVLKGGAREDWMTRRLPQRVEVPAGYPMRRLHLLGAVGAWGFPSRRDHQPCITLTFQYADGTAEEVVLTDGIEIADWIGRFDVPGSSYVQGVLSPQSRGQLRYLSVTPSREDVVVDSVVLESAGNHVAPVFFALTAEIAQDPEPRED